MRTLTCPMCGRRFQARASNAKVCGPTCRQRARRARMEAAGPVTAGKGTGGLLGASPVSVEVPTRLDEWGRPVDTVAVSSIEAATHWDCRAWKES